MNPAIPVTAAATSNDSTRPRAYGWIVFALTIGLMMSDYLPRQVIGAVIPAPKAEWGILDAQLGMLVSIVSLVVGVLTVPISLVADRWGRVRSITLMAFVWCLATVACGLAQNYGQLPWARAFVGLGEAGVFGLKVALTATPVVALMAAGFFVLVARSYEADAARQRAVVAGEAS